MPRPHPAAPASETRVQSAADRSPPLLSAGVRLASLSGHFLDRVRCPMLNTSKINYLNSQKYNRFDCSQLQDNEEVQRGNFINSDNSYHEKFCSLHYYTITYKRNLMSRRRELFSI